MTDDIKTCHKCGSTDIQIISIDEPKIGKLVEIVRCKDCKEAMLTDYKYTEEELGQTQVDLKACLKDSMHRGLVEKWHELCAGTLKKDDGETNVNGEK